MPDTIIDNHSVPAETRIYYSKKKSFFEITVLSICFLVGGWFLIFKEGENRVLGLVLCVITGIFLYIDYYKLINKNVQILLTDRGLQTSDTEFYTWQQISRESVTKESFKGNINYFLNYDYKSGSARLLINNLDFSPQEIEKLIGIYRKRSGNK
jgi:hypothetical protein